MTTTQPTGAAPAPADDRIPTHEVDASCRWPLLAIFSSAGFWLLLGSLLSLLAAIKLHKGDFLADCPWLTLGRVRPAGMNLLLYGFASQASLGVLLWLLCRLGNVRFVFQVPVLIATKVWNLGVLVGLIGILSGQTTGFEWLEMPRAASVMIFVSYVVFGLCAVATFQMRRVRELYPSQWFLFAALFWFPWIYSAAHYLLVLDPVRGTFQSVVSAWFTGSFATMWLGPVALGALYYFLPKLTGKPLYSASLAAFAFWTLMAFGSWTGMATLLGAPVPRWVSSVGTAAVLCMLTPLLANAVNWYSTSCYLDLFKKNAEARFLVLGAGFYLLGGLVDLLLSSPGPGAQASLTLAGMGAKALFLHGFVSSVLLGSIYYILPRILQVAWPCERSLRIHFALHAIGAGLIGIGLLVGGGIQGAKLANASIPFLAIAKGTAPFVGLATGGVLLMLLGQVLLVLNLARIARGFIEPQVRAMLVGCCGCAPVKAGVKS